MSLKKKITFIFLAIISLLILSLITLKNNYQLRQTVLSLFPEKYVVIIKIIFGDNKYLLQNLNDYNVKFLPETQFINLDFNKIKIKNLDIKSAGYNQMLKGNYFSFNINQYLNKIILTTRSEIIYINTKDLEETNLLAKRINHNLPINIDIKDSKIFNEEIFVSFSEHNKLKNCKNLVLSKAIFNLESLVFKEIIKFDECANYIQGGKIDVFKVLDQNKILISTAGDILAFKNERDPKPQDDKSIFGKILLVDEYKKSFNIFSKGHRNPLGLLYDKKNKIILSTENGPRGGDEINLIKFGQNNGWDIVSYGERYSSKEEKYKKNHEQLGFQEPIYSFVPSIGISEIINLENNFSKKWKNNFLIASLNSKHLYRIKLNTSFSKLIYKEEIFIGERIRDIFYLEDEKMILLALENTGSIGILRVNK